MEWIFVLIHFYLQSRPSARAGWPVCAWPTSSGRWVAGLASTTSTLEGMLSDLNGQLDGATLLSEIGRPLSGGSFLGATLALAGSETCGGSPSM